MPHSPNPRSAIAPRRAVRAQRGGGRSLQRRALLCGALLSSIVAWGCSSNGGVGGSGGAQSSGGTGGPTPLGGAAGSGGATPTNGGAGQGGAQAGTGGSNIAGSANPGGANSAGGQSGGLGGASMVAGSGGTAAGSGGGGGVGAVTVQLDKPKQTIDGFGINDTWNALTDAQAQSLFDTTSGIGLTILRVGMNPSGGFYNNNEASSIAAAKKYGATTIIGSVWSPPANCKDNKSTTKGGHLLASCYGTWSDSITTFAKNNNLYAMSAGNEPDFASCGSTIGPPCNGDYDTTLFTANEMVAFVRVLGPKLKAAGVKLISPEASEWIHTWSNTSATGSTVASYPNSSDPLKCGCFGTSTNCSASCASGDGYDYGHYLYKDPAAWAAVDILGVHQYDSQVAEPWPADVPDKKPVWQTEMSGVKYWPEGEPSKDIQNGVAVAGWIHNALVVGDANAWLWWWYKGQGTNEGLYLADGSDTKRHYTFGNFTKFIRPGYVRVDMTGGVPANVLLSAYKSMDGTVVLVAINKGTSASTVPVTISGGAAPSSCTPTVTSASEDLKAGTAVPVNGGILTASLAGLTVTTFVCK
jgi:glucuronoarabinoxylan endo-1,4-beta-xylanase